MELLPLSALVPLALPALVPQVPLPLVPLVPLAQETLLAPCATAPQLDGPANWQHRHSYLLGL